MGGGGSIQGMLDSLRHNRGQLKKHRRSFKEIAENYPIQGRKIDLKKASPEEIAVIKSVIRKRQKRRNLVSGILLALLLAIGIWAISLII